MTGAGVVLAQRLEQLARPGGVCISAAVREALPDRLPLNHEDLGAQKIKGFDLPVVANAVSLRDGEMLPPASRPPRGLRAVPPRWRRAVGAVLFVTTFLSGLIWLQSGTTDVEPAVLTRLSHPLPDRPSVAVLPFTNLSDGIEGQDQFAEGVSEDIITDLSKVSGLFVVARDAAFAHDSPERVVGQVAEALGVRYVLDGGVRRSGNRVRVTTQLVDALHGKLIWAERYDRNLKDVFAVQSDVASQVARAMAVTLKSGEHERLFQKHVASIDAYDVFIRARRTVDVPSRANIETGEKLMNGDYAKAERLWRIRNEKFPAGSALPLVFLAASYSLQDNLAEARAVATRLRKDFPAFRLEAWGWSRTYHLPENRERLHRGARLAGIA